ncbi:MAG: FGGY family carbohydrate kinase [Promethearchaeota archaeon]
MQLKIEKEDAIFSIDISSRSIKIVVINFKGEILNSYSKSHKILTDEDTEFGRLLDIEQIWGGIIEGLKELTKFAMEKGIKIVAISGCAQRISALFLGKDKDETGEYIPVYCGANIDTRGVDSEWMIDDEFSEEELFDITARGPPLLFGPARLLWFKEEKEEIYNQVYKYMSLDDYLAYKFTHKFVTDYGNASDSGLFDIDAGRWSSEIINRFEFNEEWFPEVVESGSIVGNVIPKVLKEIGLVSNGDEEKNLGTNPIVFIKGGGDTHLSVLGMGCINSGDLGIVLGSSTPIFYITKTLIKDPQSNIWTNYYLNGNTWAIEANTGFTGRIIEWFLRSFYDSLDYSKIDMALKMIKPGSDGVMADLGPGKMDFKNQTDIPQSFFKFPSQSSILEVDINRETFLRAAIENIIYGIVENIELIDEMLEAVEKFDANGQEPKDRDKEENQEKIKDKEADLKKIKRIFCGGGLSKSKGIIEILASIINKEIFVPENALSAHIGHIILTSKALGIYPDYLTAINNIIKLKKIKPKHELYILYKKLFPNWKKFKSETKK